MIKGPKNDIRVLIVDDFWTMRRIMKNIFYQLNFTNIVEADDGMAALDVLHREQIDLIVSDWNMPKMTGLELLKAVRADDALKHIPFLMVTAVAQQESLSEAMKSGLNNFIFKPFEAGMLRLKIRQIFSE